MYTVKDTHVSPPLPAQCASLSLCRNDRHCPTQHAGAVKTAPGTVILGKCSHYGADHTAIPGNMVDIEALTIRCLTHPFTEAADQRGWIYYWRLAAPLI